MAAQFHKSMESNDGPHLLVAEDDPLFRSVLARAISRRGIRVSCAASVTEAQTLYRGDVPDYAVVDLKMPGESGLVLVEWLKKRNPAIRIVMLTAYASISTAIEAVKLGADHYLAKPADVEEILGTLGLGGCAVTPPPQVDSGARLSTSELEMLYIMRMLATHDGNISAAARAMNMHRRTLQRKLARIAPATVADRKSAGE